MTDVSGNPAPPSAQERLRAFEDDRFSPGDRVGGEIQKGHGSNYQKLSAEQRAHHTALEKAVEAERKLDQARIDLMKAEEDVARTNRAVEATFREGAGGRGS